LFAVVQQRSICSLKVRTAVFATGANLNIGNQQLPCCPECDVYFHATHRQYRVCASLALYKINMTRAGIGRLKGVDAERKKNESCASQRRPSAEAQFIHLVHNISITRCARKEKHRAACTVAGYLCVIYNGW
jgi:hypothetical protein